MNTADIFQSFGQMKVLVVGDIMLDAYLQGAVTRISTEAPVPIVNIQKKETRAGGAANVAINCKALGTQVAIAGTIGQDADGEAILHLLDMAGLDTSLVQAIPNRRTTTKTRILSRHQQMIRFDAEEVSDIPLPHEHAFIGQVLKYLQIQKPDVVIIEDYNKGLLTENIIQQIIQHCRVLRIPVAVDPKTGNFFTYQGVTIFKPNLKEVREGLHIPLAPVTLESLQEAHRLLAKQLNHQISFITLSELGVFYDDGEQSAVIPSHHRIIADVSGAGDTVIAVAAVTYAQTKDIATMAAWANLAGGLVCEEVGVVPIDKDRLIKEIENNYLKEATKTN